MADFPPGTAKEDSKFFNIATPNPAMRNETDGGYTITRPRFTRKPVKTWTTGFTNLSLAQKEVVQAFYETKMGGAVSFTWTDPTSATTYVVRFKGDLKWKYAGHGPTFRFDSDPIELEQV